MTGLIHGITVLNLDMLKALSFLTRDTTNVTMLIYFIHSSHESL